MAIINLTAGFTGTSLPLNAYSILVSVLGGIPGVITILVLRIIWPL